MADYDLGTAHGKIVIDSDAKGVKNVNDELDAMPAKGKKASEAVNLESALNKTSNAAIVTGGAIVGGLALAVKSASDFEYGMSQIQSVLGLTTEAMEPLREAALRIGQDTAFSASEAAVAIEELAKSGLTAEEILNGAADATVALAAAGQIELPEAAAIASAAMNQFKLGAEDMTDVANIMAGAANASATGVSEIGMALSFVGPTAQAAGVGLEDAAAMIALFANNGIDGARAGTALRALILNLSNPTKQAAEAMKELGLMTAEGQSAFYNADGTFKSMAEVTDLLRNSMSGLTSEQQIAYGEAMVGSAQLSALSAITSSTADEFSNLQTTIANTSAADVAQTRMGNLEGTIEQMWGAVETAAIKVGNVLIPALTQAAQVVADVVDWFSNLDDGVRNAMVSTVAIGGAILLLGGLFTKAVMGIVELVNAVKAVQAAFVAMEIGAKLAAAATAIWNGITTAAAAVARVFNAVLMANPIGLIITAIAAVVAALIWFFTQTEVGQTIIREFWNFLQEAWANIAAVTTQVWTAITTFLAQAWQNIVSFVTPIVQGFIDFFVNAWNGIVGFLTPIFEFIATVIKTYVEVWINIFLVLAAVLVTIWNGIVAAATWVWEQIMSFIGPIIENIASFITTVFTEVSNFWRDVWNGIIDFLTPILINIYSFINDTINNVKAGWEAVWGAVSSFFQTIWNAIISFLMPIVSRIASTIQSTITTVQNVWNTVWSAISSFFSDIWNGIVNAVTTAVSSVISTVSGIYGQIMGALSGAASWLFGVGQDIIRGMIEGITSMFKSVVNAITNVVDGAITWAKDVLGIASPSKEFAAIGVDTMRGLMQGIDSLTPDLNRQIDALGLGLSANMQQSLNLIPGDGDSGVTNNNVNVNYTGAGFDAEDDLFDAMKRAKVVVPGW